MEQPSEGIKRIVLVLSFLFVGTWSLFALIVIDGFSRAGTGELAFFIIGLPITFFLPQATMKVIYWVKDGFTQDKNS